MIFSISLALRYLTSRKLRTTLTTLAIALGVMLLFGLDSLLPGAVQSFRQNMLAATNQVDLTISGEMDGSFSFDRIELVQHQAGIQAATASLRRNVLLPQPAAAPTIAGKPGLSAGPGMITVAGVQPDTLPSVRPLEILSGRLLQTGDSASIVISDTLAGQLKLKVNDSLTLPATNGSLKFNVVGIVRGRILPGTDEVYIPLQQAQIMFNLPGKINTIEAMYVAGSDREKIAADLKAALGETFQFGELDLSSGMLASLQIGEVALNLFGSLALLMSGFIIFNTFRTLVIERRRDIGLLRAVGASRRTVLRLILVESLVQGALGTALGLLLGLGLAYAMHQVMGSIFEQYLRFSLGSLLISPLTVLLAIVMGMGTTLLGGLIPALSTNRVTPLDALRPIIATPAGMVHSNLIPGGALIAIALIGLLSGNFGLTTLGMILFLSGLVWIAPAIVQPIAVVFRRLTQRVFMREGHIASGNLARQPGRSAITASSVMIGLAVILAMYGMITSLSSAFMGYIDKNLGADYILMPQSLILGSGNVGATPDLIKRILAMPGVKNATSLRASKAKVGSEDVQMIGIDPQAYPLLAGLVFKEGNDSLYVDMAKGRAMVINGVFGLQNNVQVGQEVQLHTPTGEHTYKVLGIGLDYLNAKMATAYISHENLAQDFGEINELLVMVNKQTEAAPDEVRMALAAQIQDYPGFTLFSSLEWRQTQLDALNGAFGLFYLLLLVLALPSLLALINTLAINVLERTREIGLLRAVGATRRQISRLVLIESLLLVTMGTIMGILAGLWMGYVMVSAMSMTGFVITYNFPLAGILLTVTVGLSCGVLAAWLPARQAARVGLIEALQYE